jgi:hypothetical protein
MTESDEQELREFMRLKHLSLDKTPRDSEINSLRNFLSSAFCYQLQLCSDSCGFGLARS